MRNIHFLLRCVALCLPITIRISARLPAFLLVCDLLLSVLSHPVVDEDVDDGQKGEGDDTSAQQPEEVYY